MTAARKLMGYKSGWVVCRHCNRERFNQGRQLCWSCWSDESVRALYPMRLGEGAGGNRNHGGWDSEAGGGFREPAEPTDAAPGSEEKIEILAARFKAGVCLWHKKDARIDLR